MRRIRYGLCLLPFLAACAASGGGAPASGAVCPELEGLSGHARDHVAAVARLLAAKPSMAIDFTATSGETCLNAGGPVMTHVSVRPAATREDLVYFVDAGPLVEKGLRLEEFPALEPGLGTMEPGTWYRYEGRGREPHHGLELRDRTWLMVAVDVH